MRAPMRVLIATSLRCSLRPIETAPGWYVREIGALERAEARAWFDVLAEKRGAKHKHTIAIRRVLKAHEGRMEEAGHRLRGVA